MATLVILQKDLRLRDNPALFYASENGRPIIVVHIMEKRIGSALKWWLSESLRIFRTQLEPFGIPLLHLPKSNKNDVIALVNYIEIHIRIIEINSNGLDFELPESLQIIHKAFMSNFIFDPEEISKQFKIFTPFWRYLRTNFSHVYPLDCPHFTAHNRVDINFSLYTKLPEIPNGDRWCKMKLIWQIGEEEAQKKYRNFAKSNLTKYNQKRDVFSQDTTSRLSPHIRFGEISVRQLYHELSNNENNERFVAELGWREFAYHLLRRHPDMYKVPLNPKYKDFWNTEYDEGHLKAWQAGQTGYPVIDAAMRELWSTGWIHNRLRMLVASFLVKNLLIPWQIGEQWFYDCLVDGDLANNSMNWQWMAGCGTDSVPYFRIFNPMLQGEKFDPKGSYVRSWIPELRTLPQDINIHQDMFRDSNIRPKNYPKPIIDYAESRKKALEMYEEIIVPKFRSKNL